ncbi:DUF4038 domain-containing protein [Planctomonas sp. JC2975]|uniref:apiosidase-like domain-containing protein n=1 Tax=Planctomonas sp. JC2975 TaxID=2729626 RepID=UPI0014758120|nr:DUF4038 domain-containing protein [Planctomonas sp. JC2975]NNC10709.1 DUF4038 domain-containing protein [Planctomonas sp. JC2975]
MAALGAEYGFPESSGSTSADSSGNGNTATIVSGTFTTSGHTGNGLQTSSAAGATSTPFQASTPFWTLMAWVKFTSFGSGYSSVIEMPEASNRAFFLEASGSGALDTFFRTTASSSGEVDYGTTLSTGTWYHLAVAFSSGSGGHGTLTLFVNGASVGTADLPTPGAFTSADTFYMGGSTDQPGSMIVDDARFYPSALVAADVTTAMNTPATTPSTPGAAALSGTGTLAASGHAGSGTAALSGSGTLTAHGPVVTPPFATTVTGNRLLDQYGAPFLIRGDSPWCLPQNVSTTDAMTYMDQAQTAGFNLIIVQALGTSGAGVASSVSATFDGVAPFTNYADWSTGYNESYWTRLDAIITGAASRGITVMLFPAFGGKSGSGALYDLAAQASSHWTAFGTFLGTRYKTAPNLIWGAGGDWPSTNWASSVASVNAMIAAIKAAGDTHLWTTENYQDQWSSSNTSIVGGVDLEYGYTYQAAYKLARTAKAATSKPYFLGESEYEGENNENGPATTDQTLRRQAAWSYAQGAIGDISGTHYWDLHTGWSGSLATTAMGELGKIRNAVAALTGWQNLAPSTTLITSGAGTDTATGTMTGSGVDPLESSYAVASVTADKSLALLYNPDSSVNTSVVLDATKVGASPSLTRIDPTSGTSTSLTWTTTLTNPGANAAGDHDWLYVITAAPAVTGSASLSGTGTLAASGKPSTAGSAALSGTGGLTATAAPSVPAAATLTGAGTLSATGKPAGVAAAALAGVGTLTASSSSAATTAALGGTGTLAATATPGLTGAAVLNGTGLLHATAAGTVVAIAALTGSGVLTAVASDTKPVIPAVRTLTGHAPIHTLTGYAEVHTLKGDPMGAEVKQGEKRSITFTANADLTGCTVQLWCRQVGGTATTVLDSTITDPVNGVVTCKLDGTLDAGTYTVMLEATTTDGDDDKFPSDGFEFLTVGASL